MTTLTAPARTHQPSPQQQDVLDWVRFGKGSLNLIARAGCGKTSTLKMVAVELVQNGLPNKYDSAFIGAFNKPIADEIEDAIRALGIPWNKVGVGTMHSAGVGAWNKVCKAKVVPNKVARLFDELWPLTPATDLCPRPIQPGERLYREFVIKAVSYAKGQAFGVLTAIENEARWYEMVEHFGLDEDLTEEDGRLEVGIGIRLAIQVYRASLDACREAIDYDDMILAPLYFKARFWKHAWVMIDEAQDTNPARRALALAMLRPGGRLIAVGDPAQAIYGFTGADADAMQLLGTALNSATLPLNLTYRCPKAVVELAQTWVPDIQAAVTAPEGIVRTISEEQFHLEAFQPTDAILCRKSAPLAAIALALLRQGIPCKMEGRKIGEGLAKLVRRFKVRTLEALSNKLSIYLDRESAKLMAKEQEGKAADLTDQVETLLVLIDQCLAERLTRVDDLLNKLDSMFGDDVTAAGMLTLATVHKSKGREWDRVYLFGRNAFMPSRWARKEWQLDQEDHLCYVAVTRTKRELVEVWVEKEKKEGR